MKHGVDQDIKRLIDGREGPDGARAVIDTYRWVVNGRWLQQAIATLQRARVATDGTVGQRTAQQQERDRQILKDLEAQIEGEHAAGSRRANPSLGNLLTQDVAIADQVSAVRWRVSLDWAIGSIAKLRLSDRALRQEAETSMSHVASLADTSFDAFTLRVTENATYVQQAISRSGVGL